MDFPAPRKLKFEARDNKFSLAQCRTEIEGFGIDTTNKTYQVLVEDGTKARNPVWEKLKWTEEMDNENWNSEKDCISIKEDGVEVSFETICGRSE